MVKYQDMHVILNEQANEWPHTSNEHANLVGDKDNESLYKNINIYTHDWSIYIYIYIYIYI